MPAPDPERDLLRHALATIAYRGAKSFRSAPDSFADLAIPNSPRTPLKILAHIGDLFDWALSIAQGQQTWRNSTPLEWNAEVARFFSSLKAFDDYLASEGPLHETPAKLMQAPIADALAHVGQLTILRRISGQPIRSENYHQAAITAGKVGPDQTAPRHEFD